MTDKHTHKQTDRQTHIRTSRLIESIGLRADALKITIHVLQRAREKGLIFRAPQPCQNLTRQELLSIPYGILLASIEPDIQNTIFIKQFNDLIDGFATDENEVMPDH